MDAHGKHMSDVEGEDILPLREVDITASRKELRKLAKFFRRAAKNLRRDDHWHYQSTVGVFPDFVVMLSPKKED